MTVLRCTASLLKRMKYPAKPEEPEPQRNPLGEWYADLLIWKRHPLVVLMNADTGVVMVLPGLAADLVRLSLHAQLHFEVLCNQFDLQGKAVEAEIRGFKGGFYCGATRDRSLVGSLKERKLDLADTFDHGTKSKFDAAAHCWEGLFLPSKHSSHPPSGPHDYKTPLALARERLMPQTPLFPVNPART
ncbi:hypothetical protein [Stenotrophomonas sp. JAI102]|uniref:DUF6933 domain-containing protein n=1 Tax=Stenotrophomonas sp. JAI102 TaxID=2723077 RepID=UPI0015CCF474|nr:hypothetical protein [Stenotrophomonas sp. JAI102]